MKTRPIFSAVDCEESRRVERHSECLVCVHSRGIDDGFQHCAYDTYAGIAYITVFDAVECPKASGDLLTTENCLVCEYDGGQDGNGIGCLFTPEPEAIEPVYRGSEE